MLLNSTQNQAQFISPSLQFFSRNVSSAPHFSFYHMPLDGSLLCLFGYYKALKRTQTIKRKTSWSHSNIKAHFSLDQLCQGRSRHFTWRAVISAPLVTDHRTKPWLVLLQAAPQLDSVQFARMDIFTEAVKRNVHCLQAPSSDMFSNT